MPALLVVYRADITGQAFAEAAPHFAPNVRLLGLSLEEALSNTCPPKLQSMAESLRYENWNDDAYDE